MRGKGWVLRRVWWLSPPLKPPLVPAPNSLQNIALLGPAACLGLCMYLASSGSDHSRDVVLPLITVADGLSAFSLAGL